MVSWSSKATFSASGINKSGKETGHESNKSFVCAFDFLRSIEEFLMMVLYCSSLISSLVKSIISIVFLLPSLLCVITAFCGVIENSRLLETSFELILPVTATDPLVIEIVAGAVSLGTVDDLVLGEGKLWLMSVHECTEWETILCGVLECPGL